jgi:hypothetical protein
LLVLVSQRGQVLAVAEVVLVAAATLAVAAAPAVLLEAALAPRQPSTVAAFGQRRLSVAVVHTLPAEASAE